MNNLERTHQWMLQRIKPNTHIVDMTCGNGHDTYFLAQYAKRVTAVDIQIQAIENTKKRCEDYSNINYIHSDHAHIDFKSLAPISGAIYNLGYLPSGDKSLITHTESTILSLTQLIQFVQDFIVITCYPRHTGGLEETIAVQEFIQSHHLKYEKFTYDKPLSPITYCIEIS